MKRKGMSAKDFCITIGLAFAAMGLGPQGKIQTPVVYGPRAIAVQRQPQQDIPYLDRRANLNQNYTTK